MTIEELKAKKEQLESQISKLLRDFHGETGILITNISVTTVQVSCGEVIAGIRTEVKI